MASLAIEDLVSRKRLTTVVSVEETSTQVKLAHRRAVPRLRVDAEAGVIRVLIRTGKHMSQLVGEDLLAYADLVKTSGRSRREHLIWELLVQAGPLHGEPATLRAVWTAKTNRRQHGAADVLDRYGIPASS